MEKTDFNRFYFPAQNTLKYFNMAIENFMVHYFVFLSGDGT